jgi:hypothetical protein
MLLIVGATASHPIGIAVPLALLIIIWWERGRVLQQDLKSLAPLLALSLVWLIVLMVADVRRVAYHVAAEDTGILARLAVAPRAIWAYLGHLALPVRLSFGYPNYSNAAAWMSMAFAGALIGILAIAWGLLEIRARTIRRRVALRFAGAANVHCADGPSRIRRRRGRPHRILGGDGAAGGGCVSDRDTAPDVEIAATWRRGRRFVYARAGGFCGVAAE